MAKPRKPTFDPRLSLALDEANQQAEHADMDARIALAMRLFARYMKRRLERGVPTEEAHR